MKKAATRPPSDVWKVFSVDPNDPALAVCNECNIRVKTTWRKKFSNTSNMAKHIKTNHKELELGTYVKKPTPMKKLAIVKKHGRSSFKQLSKIWNVFSLDPRNSCIAICVVCNVRVKRGGQKLSMANTSNMIGHFERFHRGIDYKTFNKTAFEKETCPDQAMESSAETAESDEDIVPEAMALEYPDPSTGVNGTALPVEKLQLKNPLKFARKRKWNEGQLKSPIWNTYNLDRENLGIAICDLCNKRVKRDGSSTSHMRYHMKYGHPLINCETYKKRKRPRTSSQLTSRTAATTLEETSGTRSDRPQQESNVDEAVPSTSRKRTTAYFGEKCSKRRKTKHEKFIRYKSGKLKKKVPLRSKIWRAFHLDPENGQFAICAECNKRMERGKSSTTSHMRNHLNTHHKGLDLETYVKKELVLSYHQPEVSSQVTVQVHETSEAEVDVNNDESDNECGSWRLRLDESSSTEIDEEALNGTDAMNPAESNFESENYWHETVDKQSSTLCSVCKTKEALAHSTYCSGVCFYEDEEKKMNQKANENKSSASKDTEEPATSGMKENRVESDDDSGNCSEGLYL